MPWELPWWLPPPEPTPDNKVSQDHPQQLSRSEPPPKKWFHRSKESLCDAIIDDFSFSHDPSQLVCVNHQFDDLFMGKRKTPISLSSQSQNQGHWKIILQVISSLMCFHGTSSILALIVDSGPLVYISPLREAFVTSKSSNAKIKDLSKSNEVEGTGLICWKIFNTYGEIFILELPVYCIPNAEVQLLSHQVLFDDNWRSISANYCRYTYPT